MDNSEAAEENPKGVSIEVPEVRVRFGVPANEEERVASGKPETGE